MVVGGWVGVGAGGRAGGLGRAHVGRGLALPPARLSADTAETKCPPTFNCQTVLGSCSAHRLPCRESPLAEALPQNPRSRAGAGGHTRSPRRPGRPAKRRAYRGRGTAGRANVGKRRAQVTVLAIHSLQGRLLEAGFGAQAPFVGNAEAQRKQDGDAELRLLAPQLHTLARAVSTHHPAWPLYCIHPCSRPLDHAHASSCSPTRLFSHASPVSSRQPIRQVESVPLGSSPAGSPQPVLNRLRLQRTTCRAKQVAGGSNVQVGP